MKLCPKGHERFELDGPCPACLLTADEPVILGGRYRLDDEIGEGGTGVVFRAFDTKLKREVALKIAKGPLDEAARARFVREAQLLATLRHPSIVTALDIGDEDGQIFIVMELVEGVSLAHIASLERGEIDGIARDICEALAHAHERGIVHRDIKPENILIDSSRRARLTDFGIARLAEDTQRFTKDGFVAGTPRYMAPEALRGEAPAPSHDVYSLGLVLTELIERHPNAASSLATVRAARNAGSLDRATRFTTAAQMSAALNESSVASNLPPLGNPRELMSAVFWLRPLAVLLSLAIASILWAFLSSVTPRVMSRVDVGPLVMTQVKDLGDGRVLSTARFETGAWLAAILIATFAGSLFAAWWTLPKQLPATASAVPREKNWLLIASALNLGLWIIHVGLIGRDRPSFIVRYMPIGGGLTEMALLVLLSAATLEVLLRGQNPLKVWWLWATGVLMVIPPTIELLHFIDTFSP